MSSAEDPFRLSEEVVQAVAASRPMTATMWGIAGHDDAWDDLSPEGHDRLRRQLEAFVARVPTLPEAADRWTRLAANVLSDFLRLEIDRYEHDDHLTDLNNIASSFQMIRMVFDMMDASTDEAWRARVSRLETLSDALGGYRQTLERGLQSGRVVAARQVRAAIAQARVHAGETSFFRTLPAAMAEGGVRDPVLTSRLEAAVPRACEAMSGFATWLDATYLPGARTTDAVGRDRYVREARRFLGMAIDPDETYAWGWREVASIATRMRALAERIAPGSSIADVLALLKSDPTRCAPTIDSFLDVMRARQREALDQLSGTHFHVPAPVRTLDVKLAPPGGALGAYYAGPSDGFKRAGCVWYSTGGASMFPLFDQISTAYHEGFPGHHLQIGTQVALTDRLSRLHRVADGYVGYAEGWALYAERLMDELGYYESLDYQFGLLSNQMIRACRVVIDIGSHLTLPIPADQPFHPGEAWTFDVGVEMLMQLGGLDEARAASEMTRYLGWPGQAISYKVGERVILDLRDAERARLGAQYDPARFHARILGCGNVGLDQLKQLVMDARSEAGSRETV